LIPWLHPLTIKRSRARLRTSARGRGSVRRRQPASDLLRSADGGKRFWEFFTANIRNKNTHKAYFVAVSQFSGWCESRKLTLEQVQPIHVAGYIEQLGNTLAKPSIKQHLAAIRMLFDWLVTGQIIASNPAHRSADQSTA
jgi:site-specific recombinase XerD